MGHTAAGAGRGGISAQEVRPSTGPQYREESARAFVLDMDYDDAVRHARDYAEKTTAYSYRIPPGKAIQKFPGGSCGVIPP